MGLDLHHDLLMFDAARNFYSGQIPYKDFFYQYNLGTIFLHGSTLDVLGLKISSLKKITVLFYALIALLIYLSCAVEGFRRSGFLLSILWAFLSPFYMPILNGYHPWPTIYMMFACMAGLLCMQLAIRNNPFIFSFLAGAFLCLGFWFKQVALFQIIAVTIWLALNLCSSLKNKVDQPKYIKTFAGYTLGGLLVCIPFLAYLYIESAILDWWIDTFEFNKYFAADSQNATDISTSLKIFFPISGAMESKTIFWALCPLVLCIVTFQVFIWKRASFGLSKYQKESIALFSLAGFAGWVEYFPLPHPFHTQIFMASTFVVIGMLLGKHPLNFRDIKSYFIIFLAVYIFIVDLCYEGAVHAKGWNHKRLTYKDSVSINLNSTFDDLIFDEKVEKSLVNFYQKMIDLQMSNRGDEFIPMSVDPLRGLLPGKVERPSKFLMGLDWTWPNELVEPGFSQKLNSQILLHQQPIYADSLIYIPGYMPDALLEMKAPISGVHTLYKPLALTSKLLTRAINKNEILYATNNDLNIKARSILFDWNSDSVELNLIPFDDLNLEAIEDIKNIHVTIIEAEEFPRHLSPLQMGYLNKAGSYYGGDLPILFKLDDDGGGFLRDDISFEDEKNLALFMLSSGKLFINQSRPVYSSTLSVKFVNQPMIVSLSAGNPHINVLWSKKIDNTFRANLGADNEKNILIYLAIKPLINKGGSKFIVVQVELKGDQMKNYFYTFRDDEK